MVAHDLAADWGWMETHRGFVVGASGRVVWEEAQYLRGNKVRIGRLVANADGTLSAIVRYVDPETTVTLV